MKEQTWTRKEINSWDEAFRALAPVIRQQSVRVASYTQVLFTQACASSYGVQTPAGAERMRIRLADLAYKCGLYHQIGKALVPHEYQVWHEDFTEEEKDVYKKYTSDGRLLTIHLQKKIMHVKEKRSGEFVTESIPWMMIHESCQQHMERWDGSGYPDGKVANEISPIAQIVGLAKELDRLASETKSENPFDEAFEELTAQADVKFSRELINILIAAKSKCHQVYLNYVHYTMTLPKTIPLVDKRPDRPMGLSYRPMVNGLEGKINAYEAIPWFGGLADGSSETENIEIIEPQLRRLGLVPEISTYFLYEAADTLLRIRNCKLAIDAIVLDMIPSFFMDVSQLPRFEKLFEDQPIDKKCLILTIPDFVVVHANEELEEILKSYTENGVTLMVDSWNPETLPLERILDFGFTHVRLHPDLYLKREIADILTSLREYDIKVYAKDADTEDAIRWLVACGANHFVSAATGPLVDEETLIREALLREQENA